MNRFVAAFRVLLGQRVTPLQIEKEWLEYKLIFEDLLNRWSASLARDAKAERKRIKRLQADDQEDQSSHPPLKGKDQLRAKYGQLKLEGLRPRGPRPPQNQEEAG